MTALAVTDADVELAAELFDRVEAATATPGGAGVTRPSYSAQETEVADILSGAAEAFGLNVDLDAAGNRYFTLGCEHPEAPPLIIGSHLDSVAEGGNYDGLAGILAGLLIARSLPRRAPARRRPVVVAAFRGEENAWFGVQHVGSRAALGLLDLGLLETATRIDTGRSLAECIAAVGGDPERLVSEPPQISATGTHQYLELHIEQGPVLVERDRRVAVVASIRGYARCADWRCEGHYGHSGTVPRELRRDAVLASCRLADRVADHWQRAEERGEDLVVTFGRFATNPASSGVTTVPGEVRLSFDARSHSRATLDALVDALRAEVAAAEAAYGVAFRGLDPVRRDPVPMSREIVDGLLAGCQRLGVEPLTMPSGADHDASDFAIAGVPTGMVFVRNEHGSHNPDEQLELDDFACGVRVLAEHVESVV